MTQTSPKIMQLFSRVNLVCAIIGAALLFGVASIICFEVLNRALGGRSQLWVIEVSEYALLFITFLGAPYLLEKNKHVMIDLLYKRASGGGRRALRIFNSTIGFLTCAILTCIGVLVAIDQFQVGVREVTYLRPLSWWITAAMPIGVGLMSVQFLDHLIGAVRGRDV